MNQEEKIQKAYEALKTMSEFSDEYQSFRELFYQNLKTDKKDKAIEYLLMVVFKLLKSDGEVFNEVMELTQNKEDLKVWLKNTRSRL